MMDKADKMRPEAVKEIDMLDKHALRNWTKRMEKGARSGKERDDVLKNGQKMVSLFKVYGNEATTLVHSTAEPNKLTVRRRDLALQR